MSCYRMHVAYRLDTGRVVGSGPESAGGIPMRLPCGRCSGCLMERRQLWSLRCRHEASCWDHNVFLTLTYSDDALPWHGSLDRDHLTRFFKRLRSRVSGVQAAPGSEARPIRYFACGEYGTRSKRAHYHALLFNVRIDDARVYGKGSYTSELMSSLWPYGSHVIGSVTPASAAYVAGYALKKVKGAVERTLRYEVVDFATGEVVERVPEFSVMSRRPGIGQYWYDRFKRDLSNGYLVDGGSKVAVPRFYEDKYRVDFPEEVEARDYARYLESVAKDPAEMSESRLITRELVANARARFFAKSTVLED